MALVDVQNVSAVVVYYNYNRDTESVIEQLHNQGVFTIVVDNSDTPTESAYKQADYYVFLGKNVGIAAAQNIGINEAKSRGFHGVFTFDQDSVIPEQYVKNMLSVVNELPDNVGVLSPTVFDIKQQKYTNTRSYQRLKGKIYITHERKYLTEGVYFSAKPIASGQFVFMAVFSKVGAMNEKYFIDAVDTEFNLRTILAGFESVTTEKVVLSHEIGNKREIKFGSIEIVPSNHSAFRKYYIERNNIWMFRQYSSKVKGLGLEVFMTVVSQLVYVLFEKDKLNKWKNAVRGIRDGVFINY